MRFAVSRFSKAIVIGVLGCAAAILIACGDRNGLLSGDQASSLNSALDGVALACSRGAVDTALDAAARFRRDADGLSARTVDRRLVRALRDGASTLQQLVPESCETVQRTIPTIRTTSTTPETTTPTTPTTPTTSTTPPDTTSTTPPDTGGTTTPETGGGTTTPDTGGGTDGGETDGGETGGGGAGAGPNGPDVNRGNPGGALAPGQGGTE